MADAVVQVLVENLNNLILGEIGLILGVDDEIHKLSNTLVTIQGVLEDAEGRRYHSQSIQDWLRRLSGMAFEIEDLLDDCNMEVHHRGGLFNLKNLFHRYKIGTRLREAVQKLEALANDRQKFHLTQALPAEQQRDWRRQTGSIVIEPDCVYGRDEEKEKIVDTLLNQASDHRLSVLPILGIGGLGKTTLAQLVSRDQRLCHHFKNIIWVCVSDRYDLKCILESIIDSLPVTKEKPHLENLDSLQRRVVQLLSNTKNYLLILDDVWNDNQEDWANLKSILDCGSIGSSIVVTTRQQKVADIMGTLPPHCLTELTEAQCWLLMKHRAFGPETEPHPNLEAIGRRIAKKCGGLPLAAKALGGLLRFKRGEEEWIRVEESHMWNLPQEPNSVLPVLRVSYQHLPVVVKRCFAYCGLLRKGWVGKTELIFHWMAHGCIPSNGTQQVEDLGGEIWNELALRSFFEEIDTFEGETRCTMHDLIHDLSQSIMENIIHVAETESSSTGTGSNSRIRQVNSKLLNLPSSTIAAQVSTFDTIMDYRRVRSLDLNNLQTTTELPSTIHKLKYLRKLNLSSTSVVTLPRKFHRLPNLQILDLTSCTALISLPEKLRRMTSLRHILLEGCESLSHMPCRIGELPSLRTLSLFVVGDGVGSELNELEGLNLGGRLEIVHLERVQSHLKENLVQKPNLHDLVLSWDAKLTEINDAEKVLEALEPHPNLATLKIKGFRGPEFARWLGKMINLTEIYLDSCANCTHLPPIGDLPLLRSLTLSNLDHLEYIVEVSEVGAQRVKYVSLLELTVKSMPILKGWLKEERGGEIFPNLNTLSIICCPLLALKSTTGGLNSIISLELEVCRVASCLTEGALQQLIALEDLYINYCTGLDDVQFQHLHCLKCLHLVCISDMVSLPQAIQNIPSLDTLYLCFLHQLAVLPDWLPNLTSLTELAIVSCPKIPSLPSRMTNLDFLSISDCPQLERRCMKEVGEDWHKIAHIPNCDIGT